MIESPPPFTGRARFTHAEPLPRSRFISLRDSAGHHRVMGFAYHNGVTKKFTTRAHNTTVNLVLVERRATRADRSILFCVCCFGELLSRLTETRRLAIPLHPSILRSSDQFSSVPNPCCAPATPRYGDCLDDHLFSPKMNYASTTTTTPLLLSFLSSVLRFGFGISFVDFTRESRCCE
jgi:hypothetical protein